MQSLMADWINPDGKVKLLHGDCMIRMQEIPSNSVDAIVTDPPYGLCFMNREWDDISKIKLFHHKWAIEALRVLKPGGHLLSCSGTRTYHRMACAIEDVGFEIRDAALWVYACLSDDTQILTESGWKLYNEIDKDDKVAAWDSITEEIRFEPILDIYQAPYSGTMIKFLNDNTDQLLTPNHRIYQKQ